LQTETSTVPFEFSQVTGTVMSMPVHAPLWPGAKAVQPFVPFVLQVWSNIHASWHVVDVEPAGHEPQTLLGSLPLPWKPDGTLEDPSDPPVIATTVVLPSGVTPASGFSLYVWQVGSQGSFVQLVAVLRLSTRMPPPGAAPWKDCAVIVPSPPQSLHAPPLHVCVP